MELSVVLDDLPPRTEALWAHILELSRNLDPAAWVLVGGPMVMLHARARGVLDGARASQDVDVLADLVVSTENYVTCARVVREVLGHRSEPDSDGLRYRYRHSDTGSVIDILCPDHRSPAVALRTLSIEGGFQALQRRTTIEVRLRRSEAPTAVPVPDVLGARVLKAAAAVVDSREPQRHVGDLALLVSLMDDPLEERSRLKGSDRGRLLKSDPAWTTRPPATGAASAPAVNTPTSTGTRSLQTPLHDPTTRRARHARGRWQRSTRPVPTSSRQRPPSAGDGYPWSTRGL